MKDRTFNTADYAIAKAVAKRTAAAVTGRGAIAAATKKKSGAICTGLDSIAAATGQEPVASAVGLISAAVTAGWKGLSIVTERRSAAIAVGILGAAESRSAHAIAAAFCPHGRACAADGGAIVLCYYNENNELIHIRAGIVGKDGLKPNTWYSLDENGEFIEAQ